MADEKYTLAYTGEQVDTRLGADYVTEHGTSGNWNYRKWASGFCELWGYHSITPSGSTASGSGYYSDVVTLSTPFGVANAIIAGTVDNQYNIVNPDGSYANLTVSFRLWRASAVTETSVTASLIVFGRWST